MAPWGLTTWEILAGGMSGIPVFPGASSLEDTHITTHIHTHTHTPKSHSIGLDRNAKV